ncbi:peptidylprolyl isomerase [Xanthomonas hortorum]|uniref:peptidylprolyl isomerase n=1 Tax=Xanthomonas TaxID=338 RepID=UPI001A2CABE1|nr:peptidylprolyl isomerase [Xanthomonas hortorum]MBG3850438.1 peptidylprolyl isomerase [Xanthomonas hortorum pv. carotae]UTS74570.1 peptidyl-prolyl cis-trans isomerase [Xanthomonas hortorum]
MSKLFNVAVGPARATRYVLLLLGAYMTTQAAIASPTDADGREEAVPAEHARRENADSAAASIERAILAERARSQGLADDPQTAALLREAADTVLAQAERDHLLQSVTVSQADIAKRFAERPGDFDEFRLSHVFIAEQPESAPRRSHPLSQAQALERAQMLRRRIERGGDFARLAAEESDDGATAADGGQLSSMFGLYLDTPFEVPVRALAVGDVSGPVRGPGGYHLIRLEEKHTATLDTVGGMIEAQLREEMRDRAIAQLVQERSAQAAGLASSDQSQRSADADAQRIRQ